MAENGGLSVADIASGYRAGGMSIAGVIRIMANENMQEWQSSALVEQETVRAIVQAYADGLIELEAIPININQAQRRYAPSFVLGRPATCRSASYTAKTIANFLQWDDDKVGYALGALELIEEKLLTVDHFKGLGHCPGICRRAH